MRYDLWVVVKDSAGVDAILPIADELHKGGYSILLITNSKATELLTASSREHFAVKSADDVIGKHETPKALISSMCSGGGVGRDLVELLRGKCLTVVVQSLWGMLSAWSEQRYQPDFVITNDEVGKRMVCQSWPALAPMNVLTTGFPMLDKYSRVNVETEGTKAREILGLGNLPIVLFSGQGPMTAHALGELVVVLDKLAIDHYLLPRPHPRTKSDFSIEMVPWQKTLAEYRGRLVVDWFGGCTQQQLIAAVAQNGVAVAMFSTTLVEAAALRASTIAVLYPEYGMKAMAAEWADQEQFPLVELGCCAFANDRFSLQGCVRRALLGTLDQQQSQRQHIHVDGNNARRAAEILQRLF